MAFSETFENEVKSDIGLQLVVYDLSPFLYNSFISEYFKRSRNIPCAIDLMHI
jgi:hypothetical protein